MIRPCAASGSAPLKLPTALRASAAATIPQVAARSIGSVGSVSAFGPPQEAMAIAQAPKASAPEASGTIFNAVSPTTELLSLPGSPSGSGQPRDLRLAFRRRQSPRHNGSGG